MREALYLCKFGNVVVTHGSCWHAQPLSFVVFQARSVKPPVSNTARGAGRSRRATGICHTRHRWGASCWAPRYRGAGEIGLKVLGSVPPASMSPQVGVWGQKAVPGGTGAPRPRGISVPNALVPVVSQKLPRWAAFRELPGAVPSARRVASKQRFSSACLSPNPLPK